jgi:methyltransferase family protein
MARRGEEDWARAIGEQLAAGLPVPDARFDRLLPAALQRLSGLHFTPVAVAARAAAWLTAEGAAEVVDLGAGVGKFCLVGAATTPARFTGIEVRSGLVQVARDLARRLGLPRAQFVQGDLRTAPLGRYQAFYVYDPFSESTAEVDERLDPWVPTADRAADVAALLARLEAAPAGARLAMFCGLGGAEPAGWRLEGHEPIDPRGDALQLWVRT